MTGSTSAIPAPSACQFGCAEPTRRPLLCRPRGCEQQVAQLSTDLHKNRGNPTEQAAIVDVGGTRLRARSGVEDEHIYPAPMGVERMQIVRRDLDDAALAALLEEALVELRVRYGPQVKSPVLPNAEYYVAYRGPAASGCGALQHVAPGLAEIKRMYVPARYRGRGIARGLLHHLEGRAKLSGFARVRLQTGTHQPEALSLYERAGYLPTEPWGHYAADPNARCFSKALP